MDKIHRLKTRLETELGHNRVVSDSDIMERYARDETVDLNGAPDLVVRALSAGDVSIVLRACSDFCVPVTPRGAGTGVTGGAVPVMGGVVLSMEKMNRIIEIDTVNMIAVVEPGAITGQIQSAAQQHGLMYPPDPASLETCSIGGNVAESSGGPRAVKYGTTKDYILGLEFVLPDGSIIETGGKIVKNSTGYNLTGMLLGSEGTLAVITKIYLRLIPEPRHLRDLLIPFNSIDAAVDAVTNILRKRVVPAAIEFMEEDALKMVSRFLSTDIPFPEARAHLLIQVDGGSVESVYGEVEVIADAVGVKPENIYVAESAAQRERLWKARRSIREALTALSPVFLAEDCVVPRSQIAVFIKRLKQLFETKQLGSVMFGHAGDGNVHIDILKGGLDREEWNRMIPDLKRRVYRIAVDLGGTISGEHGIGCSRKEYLPFFMSTAELALMKSIKTAFDPGGILNPGKIP